MEGESFRIIRETQTSPSIQRGDKLYEKDNENHVGTLGTIMASRRPGKEDLTYVAFTAGHIIPDGQDVL